MTVLGGCLALAGLEARIGLVDDVDAALAAHDAAVLVALLERLQRIGDLHDQVLERDRYVWEGRTIERQALSVNHAARQPLFAFVAYASRSVACGGLSAPPTTL